MDTFFIFCAKYLVIVPILIFLFFLFVSLKDRLRFLTFSFISLGLTLILGKILSHFYFNPRPFVVGHFTPLINHAADNGFPSDHMLLVAGLASIITFKNSKVGVLMWILALLIGASRIYVGVHSFVDIFGSLFIALVSTYLVFVVLKNKKMI